MSRISSVYCSNASLKKILSNEFSFGYRYRFFFEGNFNLIIICVDCLSYFKYQFKASNFCFEEIKKYLSEKFLREDESQTLPIEYEQLTY